MDPESVEEAIALAEKFLVQVLKRESDCSTMDQLRLWMYYWGGKQDLVDLPPTSRSVREHILRSLFCTYNQIMCLEPLINLYPTLYGYTNTGDWLLPKTGFIICPDEDDLVSSCNCLKCARKSCCCSDNSLPCCVYCKCQIAQNVDCRIHFQNLAMMNMTMYKHDKDDILNDDCTAFISYKIIDILPNVSTFTLVCSF